MTLFDRTTGDPQSKLDNLQLTLGVYEIVFDTTLIPTEYLPVPEKMIGREFKANGKQCRVENVEYVFEEVKIFGVTVKRGFTKAIVRVKVLQNPLPALAVILGAAALLSFAAGYMVLQVRMLAEENPAIAAGLSLTSIAIGGGLLYGGYKLLRKT